MDLHDSDVQIQRAIGQGDGPRIEQAGTQVGRPPARAVERPFVDEHHARLIEGADAAAADGVEDSLGPIDEAVTRHR